MRCALAVAGTLLVALAPALVAEVLDELRRRGGRVVPELPEHVRRGAAHVAVLRDVRTEKEDARNEAKAIH